MRNYFVSFTDLLGTMRTSTLLIGYYRGLLLRSIDADLLTDKMCSIGVLTSQDQLVISSGHSIYQKNWLLLEHVQHMDMQVLLTFCELVQEIWPQIGSQLIAGTAFCQQATQISHLNYAMLCSTNSGRKMTNLAN